MNLSQCRDVDEPIACYKSEINQKEKIKYSTLMHPYGI